MVQFLFNTLGDAIIGECDGDGVVANVRGGCGPLDAAGGWIERETGWA